MTTSFSSFSPPSNTDTDTDTDTTIPSSSSTTAPAPSAAAAAGATTTTTATTTKVARYPPHHLRKTFFIEEEVGKEKEEMEQRQDIDMADTPVTMLQRNTDYRSTRTSQDDDNLGPFDDIGYTYEKGTDDKIENNNNNNNSNSNTTPSMPSHQRLTPQQLHQQIDLHQHHHQHHQPDMQQPAPPSITEKLKKRRTSLPPASDSSLQDQHLNERRRSSSASWAHGENGVPWSPWSRWRVALKLLYAVVVPAVIIYLLKNMDEQVASRHKQHQHDNQYFRRSGSEGGGDRVSLWGHHRMTGVPSPVPIESGAGSWWHRSSSTAGSDDSGEQHHHRCTGGEGVDEPRKQKQSYWFSDGDHEGQRPSC